MPPPMKAIPGFPKYFASRDGRIFSKQSGELRELKQDGSRKYLSVELILKPNFGKRMNVHKLVCLAFHGPQPYPGAMAFRLNKDWRDNRAENLYWRYLERERYIFLARIPFGAMRPCQNLLWVMQAKAHKGTHHRRV